MGRADRNETGNGIEAGISSEVESQAAELVGARGKDDDRGGRRFGASRVLTAADRDRILQDARTVEFSVALRGYDREQVDRYVEKMSRLITELEMSSSPEAAVRHALDEVSEETRDILQRAHQTAEEITARSRAKADDRLQTAERESRELREAAEQQAIETRDAARQETSRLREAAARETSELRASTEREVAELRDVVRAEVAELREGTEREVAELREAAEREVAELRETVQREVAELREAAARETQQLRAATQRESDEIRSTARRDAEETLEAADTRARELARSAETVWRERRRLIDDMRAVGEQLVAIGEAEGKRFPRFGEEGSEVAELLRDPGSAVAAGLIHDKAATPEKSNGNAEVVPGYSIRQLREGRRRLQPDRRQPVQSDLGDQRQHLRLGAAHEDAAPPRPQPASQDGKVEHHRRIGERELGQVDDDVVLCAKRTNHRAAPASLG
ncbi:MAG: DivIVA domain-containing protein [Solirubrobacterales bacterium]|nr:DivIVA domain-containing protein [Solirubrobacterales bacterium]